MTFFVTYHVKILNRQICGVRETSLFQTFNGSLTKNIGRQDSRTHTGRRLNKREAGQEGSRTGGS